MGKSSPRNPLWPDWFDGEKIDEVTFCHELIRNHPMKCIENRFFTPDGPVEDEAELKQLILKEIQAFIIHGLSKRVANLLESLRIIAYSAPLDIEVDCIHLKNGIVDVENRQLKQQLAAAKRDCAEWQTRYRDLRNDVQPYLDALLHAPERVRNFFENILARKSERTADTPSKASRQKNAEL